MIRKLVSQVTQTPTPTLIEELENRGYCVVLDVDDNSSTSITPQGIIDYFYFELCKTCGQQYVNVVTNESSDMKALMSFYKRAKASGITKKEASNHILSSLQLYYKYYGELGLNSPVTSLSFLLSKGSWILYKTFALHKTKMLEYEKSPTAISFKESLYDDLDSNFLQLQRDIHKKYLEEG